MAEIIPRSVNRSISLFAAQALSARKASEAMDSRGSSARVTPKVCSGLIASSTKLPKALQIAWVIVSPAS